MAEHMTAEQLRLQLIAIADGLREARGRVPTDDRTITAAVHLLRQLAARLSGMASGWQPIETAPRDRRIELWIPSAWDRGEGRPTHGKWDDDRYSRRPRPFWNYDFCRRVSDMRDETPSHWREPAAAPEPPHG